MVDWQHSITLEKLALRARILQQVRAFMVHRDIMEVETPILDRSGNTDPNICSLTTLVDLPAALQQQLFYLHSSPEFAMKKLLAAGAGPIYQICKVFRNNESGRMHHPEFTMLEWYRPGFDHNALMDEVDMLLQSLQLHGSTRVTYKEVFEEYVGVNPHTAQLSTLQEAAQSRGINSVLGDRSGLLDFLFSHSVMPKLGLEKPIFVYDYPACQAALAIIRDGEPALAERFELFINCVEIANGYNELCDSHELKYRFKLENQLRKQANLPMIEIDEDLVAALASGLPACAGIALGVDRLLMVIANSKQIQDVLAFPYSDHDSSS